MAMSNSEFRNDGSPEGQIDMTSVWAVTLSPESTGAHVYRLDALMERNAAELRAGGSSFHFPVVSFSTMEQAFKEARKWRLSPEQRRVVRRQYN